MYFEKRLGLALEVALALQEAWGDEPLDLGSLLVLLTNLTADDTLAHIVLSSQNVPPICELHTGTGTRSSS